MNMSKVGKKLYINGVPLPIVLHKNIKFLSKEMNENEYEKNMKSNTSGNTELYASGFQTKMKNFIRSDVIYETTGNSNVWPHGDYQKLTLVNHYNRTTSSSHTAVTIITTLNQVIEKTSENLIKLIGQNNYDTVFLALCSVLNQDLKIKAILSLLTTPKNYSTVSSQTDFDHQESVTNPQATIETQEKFCQTDILTPQTMLKGNKRRRIRRQLQPYVVSKVNKDLEETVPKNQFYVPEVSKTQQIKRIVIDPKDFEEELLINNIEKKNNQVFSFFIINVERHVTPVPPNAKQDRIQELEPQVVITGTYPLSLQLCQLCKKSWVIHRLILKCEHP